jgi:hypothetical protein
MIKAMKQALEALGPNAPECCGCRVEWEIAITALRQAIAEAEKQEPVAFRWIPSKVWGSYVLSDDREKAALAQENGIEVEPLYTHPQPKREWVGLTDEELNAIYEQHHNQYAECISPNFGYERAIEAKLKEKNS